jgi:hypothetical protein
VGAAVPITPNIVAENVGQIPNISQPILEPQLFIASTNDLALFTILRFSSEIVLNALLP